SGDNDQEKTHLGTQFGTENLHFNQSPKDKLQFIKKLQENKKFVLMLGDGLNDAGALHQSNVGIVVAENTNNFTPSCDAILDAKKFPQLTDYQLFAKKSVKLVYWAYSLAFIYNIIGLSFAVQGLLSPVIAAILMPLSSITIVFFGVLASEYLAKKVLK
ncbi:MAG: HAD family hydrolase, partial [Saprospiraceae bacterium]|nr:HAD family hydrolase [Saprospiraceae bacterium]